METITVVHTFDNGEKIIRRECNGRVTYHIARVKGGWSVGHATVHSLMEHER